MARLPSDRVPPAIDSLDAATLRQIEIANRAIAACLGISFWKRATIRDFLRTGDTAPVFCRDTNEAVSMARARGGAIAVWASREPP